MGWPERHGGFLAALRTHGPSFHFRVRLPASWRTQHGYSFTLTGLAPLGLVLELFIVKEQLLPSRENEVSAAIDTLQHLVLEFH